MNKEEIFADINSRIISNLEKGELTWRQPWQTGIPANYISKHRYQGINFLMLSFEPVSTPFFLTFLQAQQKNMRLKKGCKGRRIVFYKTLEVPTVNKSGEAVQKSIPYLKYSYVFSLEDTEGYAIPAPTLEEPNNILQTIITNHAVDIRRDMASCFYSPLGNFVATPAVSSFISEEDYFSALFHELLHWSGHSSRLNRVFGVKFGDEEYAYEELIAEIGSSYLLGLCGIQNTLGNTSAYIQHWLGKAKGDNSYILSASIHAQKAVNFLLNQSFQTEAL
jgi:antirestriction protein ArdC